MKIQASLLKRKHSNNYVEDAEAFHGAAKTSGAGGGDCGIALFDRSSSLNDLVSRWQTHDITLLPLKVYARS